MTEPVCKVEAPAVQDNLSSCDPSLSDIGYSSALCALLHRGKPSVLDLLPLGTAPAELARLWLPLLQLFQLIVLSLKLKLSCLEEAGNVPDQYLSLFDKPSILHEAACLMSMLQAQQEYRYRPCQNTSVCAASRACCSCWTSAVLLFR